MRPESIWWVLLHSFQKLIDQMHREVTAEYVRRLLKGELKLKDKALQLKACEAVTDDAESLTRLFVAMVRRRHQRLRLLRAFPSCLTGRNELLRPSRDQRRTG